MEGLTHGGGRSQGPDEAGLHFSNMTVLTGGSSSSSGILSLCLSPVWGRRRGITPASKLVVAPHHQPDCELLPGRVPVRGGPASRRQRGPAGFGGNAKVFGFLIYSRMPGGRDVYLLADFVGQLHPLPAPGQTSAPGDPDPGGAPAPGGKVLPRKSPSAAPWCSLISTVSMKYRGLYELARRDPGKLVYETELGLLDLSRGYSPMAEKFEKS